MADPILTIGDVEPSRPTIAINRTAPDGWWQGFKFRHFDILLRWFPVRFIQRRDEYPLRSPREFGLRTLERLNQAQSELRSLATATDAGSIRRAERLVQQLTASVLDAPRDAIEALSFADHMAVLKVFPQAATPQKTTPGRRRRNPRTSESSSPASIASTPASEVTG